MMALSVDHHVPPRVSSVVAGLELLMSCVCEMSQSEGS